MSDLDLLTLLAVRLRSRGSADAIRATVEHLSERTGLDIDSELVAAAANGQIRTRGEEGRRSLTPAGEAELSALLAADCDQAGRATLVTAYEAFLPLNRRFLTACQAWQHNTARVAGLEVFAELTQLLGPILDALTHRRGRFGSYRTRLAAALEHAGADGRWVDSPRIDSIHTVWFELHEHLLATLGKDRTTER